MASAKKSKSKPMIYGGLMEDYVMDGKLDKIREQLAGGVSPDWRSNQFGDVVAMAVESDKVGALRILLEAGAKADATNSSMVGALTLAATRGRTECAMALIEHGASLDGFEPEPGAPILLRPAGAAAARGYPALLNILLERGADVEASDHNGRAALMLAAINGQGDCARICIAHGANLDAQCLIEGFTPAMHALGSGESDAMLALCEAGFDASVKAWLGADIESLASRHPAAPGSKVYRAWRLSMGEREAFAQALPEEAPSRGSGPRI